MHISLSRRHRLSGLRCSPRWFTQLAAFLVLGGALAGLAGPPTVQAAFPVHSAPTQADGRAKVDPLVLDTLRTAGQAEYFVWMTEQADLSAAARLETKAEKGAFVYNTLRATAESSQASLRAELDAQGIRYQSFYIANKLFVYASDARAALAIADRPDVARITPNRHYQLPEPKVNPQAPRSDAVIAANLAFIRADQVWAQGIDGAGSVLAGNDTGLEWDHPAIIGHYRGWNGVAADHNYNWWDATGVYPTPDDLVGHGTHTTGTMVGSDGGANQIGVAPGAKTIHCKNMSNDGGGSDLTFITCFQWDLAPWDLTGANPRPDLAPDAVNNSWGYWGGGYPGFAREIDALQAAGIAVEVSAGNEGPFCGTLRSPADHSQVLTTGAIDHFSLSLPGTVSSFSSRGPSLQAEGFFPDVMAPGENIRSSVPGGGYEGGWSGTSMAGPHVTGLIGLMWSANPGLRGLVEQTYDLIKQSAVPLTGQTASGCGGDYTTGPNHDWGYGTIDALAAVDAALAFGPSGTLTGILTNAANGQPIANAIVAIEGSSWRFEARTSTAGVYTRRLPEGVYRISIVHYGFLPAPVDNVIVVEDATVTRNIALTPAPTYRVSGRVTDKNTGWPLYAAIVIGGYPGAPVWTDPVSGTYQVDLVGGMEFSFRVSPWLDGYLPMTRMVGTLTANRVVDVALEVDLVQCAAPGYVSSVQEIFTRDFEMWPDGFQFSGQTTWERGVPTTGPGMARSPTNVWATNLSGDYDNFEDGYLTSPPIDLSGYRDRNVQLHWWEWLQTESCCDLATVEVTPDGGATWNQIYLGRGDVASWWTRRAVPLDSSYADANFRFRFHFTSDLSVVYPGWYIDDIGLTDVTCRAPTRGGLVVGNVSDDITGAGLDGAVIQNADVHATTRTADGPAGAGFYTLFSPAGVKALRATGVGYTPETAMVTVAANRAVRQDYPLKSGRPELTPTALAVDLVMGETATVSFTVQNSGTGAFNYTLFEQPTGIAPAQARPGGLLALGSPLFAVDATVTTGHQNLLGVEWAAGSWWVTSAGETDFSDPNVLFQLDKDGVVLNRWEQAGDADAAWYDLAYDGEYLYASNRSNVVQVDPRTGAPTGITLPCPPNACRSLAYDPATDHFWTADYFSQIFEFGRNGEVFSQFRAGMFTSAMTWDDWTPGGPFLWTWEQEGPAQATVLQFDPHTGTPTGVSFDSISLNGSYSFAIGAAIVADHPDFPGQVIFAALQQEDTDAIAGYDLAATANRDVAWLTPKPMTGTVAAGGSQVVQATIDAGAGIQPGMYRALLVLTNDSPVGNRAVQVQMTVAASASAGKLQGVVTGLGVCDDTPALLPGVDVTLRSSAGVTILLRTNGAGAFGGWVEAGGSPYVVIAAHPNHLTNQVAGVAVSAGDVVTANVNMRLLAPCIIADAAVTNTVAYDGKTGAALTLRNVGAAGGVFAITERDLGFRSITSARHAALHAKGAAHVADEPKAAAPPASVPPLPAPVPVVAHATGGPDEFGYRFADSNAASGPVYDWVEIAPPEGGSGTELTALRFADDGYFYPLQLPFPFTFYGIDYDQIAISANGVIYFENQYIGYSNAPIPSSGYPVVTFIAPFWDDLVVYPGGIYYQDLGDRLVIEFYQLSPCCVNGGEGTFQVILFPNGSILYQYKDVVLGGGNDLGSWATVGIQGDSDTGLQYSYNTPVLAANLAICFAYPGMASNCVVDVPWMTVAPVQGAIAADGESTVGLAFDASVPEVTQPGAYLARLTVATATVTRTAQSAITLQVQPPAHWGNIHGVVRTLGICDAAPAPLHNASVNIAGAAGFSQTLQTDASGGYALWMDPAHGPFTVQTGMPGHIFQGVGGIVVPASGGVPLDFDLRRMQSCITTASTAFTATLLPGASATQVLQLRNLGAVSGNFVMRESDAPQARAPSAAADPRFDPPLFQVDSARALQATTAGLELPERQPSRILDAGAVIRTWRATANSHPWGIAYTAQGAVWVGEGWGANHMDEYRVDGTPTGRAHEYTWNPMFGPADFAYNANTGKLWVMDVSPESCVFEVDPVTGVTGARICPPWATSQRGLAFDPTTGAYFAGSWNDGRIHRFDASGAILETVAANLAVAGLAYNSTTAHLFVLENFNPNLVHVLDVADNYRNLGSFTIPGFSAFGGAGLEIDCSGALWAVDQITGSVYQVDSGESASWCFEDVPWLAETPVSGTVAADGSVTVALDFMAGDLPVGDHRATLHIVHDNLDVPALTMPVLLRVALPTVQFAQQDYSADMAVGSAVIDVRLSAPFNQPVTVDYATGDDVRVARSVGKVVFAPGQTATSFTIDLLENAPSGVLPLTLRDPVNATLGAPATAYLTLVGDDLRGFTHELWASPQAPHAGMPTTLHTIVHRLKGNGVRDVAVRFYLGAPNSSGLLLGEGVVAGLAENGSGISSGVAWTPVAPGTYSLFAVIDPDNTLAESNETNNVLYRLITVLEPTGDTQPPVVTTLAVADGASQTASRAVTLTVAAADAGDPATGATHIYVVEYQVDSVLRAWLPVQNSAGWLPLSATGAGAEASQEETDATSPATGLFDWQLTPTPGLKFLAVWVADATGNISSAPEHVALNFLPERMALADGAATLLRFALQSGDRIRLRLEPVNGDPDLYLWAPDAMTLPRPPWFSNLGGVANDALDVVTPAPGVYQVEVVGHQAAVLRLVVEIIPVVTDSTARDLSGVDPSKPVRTTPLVAPTQNPVDAAYGLNPPGATVPPHLFLPLLERS